MKKKTFAFLSGLVLIALASIYWFSITPKEQLSDIELANIEALSQIELPDVEVTCDWSYSGGRCYRQGFRLKMCNETMFYECEYTGYQNDYCLNPC
ncbi:MAG: NVEALA domain-containing protein [Clostridium sp.]|nr:NVEALA domain-containing protein [Clostridium sp.]